MQAIRDRLDTPHVHDSLNLIIVVLQAYFQLAILYWLMHGVVVILYVLVLVGTSLMVIE